MKQKVGFEQLIELDDTQKNELIKWWNKKKEGKDVPLLTIGDMIELLSDYHNGEERFCLIIEHNINADTFHGHRGENEFRVSANKAEGLCDALWDAVKSVL